MSESVGQHRVYDHAADYELGQLRQDGDLPRANNRLAPIAGGARVPRRMSTPHETWWCDGYPAHASKRRNSKASPRAVVLAAFSNLRRDRSRRASLSASPGPPTQRGVAASWKYPWQSKPDMPRRPGLPIISLPFHTLQTQIDHTAW